MKTGGDHLEVVVACPADPGQGGLGSAARDMADAFVVSGARVTYLRHDRNATWQKVGGSRGLSRFRSVRRQINGSIVGRHLPPAADLAYVMPLCAGHGGVTTVLHHATQHPRLAREQVAVARRRAGGGAVLVGALETRVMEREIAQADLIRVESGLVYCQLLDLGVPDDRLVLAPPGVDLERFRPGVRATAPVVAYVGALSLWKGLDVLVDVSRSLARHDATLEVIGGPVCRWSRRTAEPLVRARTASVSDLLARADALVLPSVVDGFGYVVLEAMASGAVPFVTPAVGAAEVVRELDPRLVIERRDFAEAVPELLTSLSLRTLGAQARVIAERRGRMAMAGLAADKLLVAARHRGLIAAG